MSVSKINWIKSDLSLWTSIILQENIKRLGDWILFSSDLFDGDKSSSKFRSGLLNPNYFLTMEDFARSIILSVSCSSLS